MTTRMEVCASLALAMMSQAFAKARIAAPGIWRPKATRVTWEPHVSIFRRVVVEFDSYRSTPAVQRTACDHRHGDLVAEEPKASSIST